MTVPEYGSGEARMWPLARYSLRVSMRRRRRILALSHLALLLLSACIDGEAQHADLVPGGDAERGAELLYQYACTNCHVVPGVTGLNSLLAAPLTDWAERQFIAGALPNTPDNLVRWIVDPQAVEPGTAMPDFGVSPEEARHMAAYLFTLGGGSELGAPHLFPKSWLEQLGPKKGGG